MDYGYVNSGSGGALTPEQEQALKEVDTLRTDFFGTTFSTPQQRFLSEFEYLKNLYESIQSSGNLTPEQEALLQEVLTLRTGHDNTPYTNSQERFVEEFRYLEELYNSIQEGSGLTQEQENLLNEITLSHVGMDNKTYSNLQSRLQADYNALNTRIDNVSTGGSIDLGNYYTKGETDTKLSNKVDKVSGKGLSTNDYTTQEKTKLAGLNNYTLPNASSTQLGGIKVGNGLSIDGNGVLNATNTGGDVDLSNYYTKGEVDQSLNNKVDKDGNKVLSTNDFTNTYKTKLDSLNNYSLPKASSNVLGGIKIGNGLSIDGNGVVSVSGGGESGGTTNRTYRVNVRDFGAKGDGVTDDSQAFKDAVAYAESFVMTQPETEWTTGVLTIYIPAGVYVISQKWALSCHIQALSGYNILGEGFKNTVIHYTYTGVEEDNYLIQVGKNPNSSSGFSFYGFMKVENIGIIGNNTNKFFGIYSQDGAPTGYRFNNINFNNLMEFVGVRFGDMDANSDMIKLFQCRCDDMPPNSSIFGIFSEENGQSLANELVNCDFNTSGYVLNIHSGGSFNIFGGSWTGDENACLINIVNTNGDTGAGNINFNFYGMRPEIYPIGFEGEIQNNGFMQLDAWAIVTFHGMTFAEFGENADNPLNEGKFFATVKHGEVNFINCCIPKNFLINAIYDGETAYYDPSRTIIRYTNCLMEEEIGKLITITETTGITTTEYMASRPILIAEGCRWNDFVNVVEDQRAIDVSIGLNGFNSMTGSLKVFKFTTSGYLDTQNYGILAPTRNETIGSNSTIKVPIGASIRKVELVKLTPITYTGVTLTYNILSNDVVIATIVADMSKGATVFSSGNILFNVDTEKQHILTISCKGSNTNKIPDGMFGGYFEVQYI